MFSITLRRSVGRTAFPVFVAVLFAQLVFRSHQWVHEWTWAVYQHGFTTVLLGPIVAGVAAWEGRRLRAERDTLSTAIRPFGAFLMRWSALATWVSLAYLATLAAAVIAVSASGTPGMPALRVLPAIFPPVFIMAAETALGLLAGWAFRHVLVAPLAAAGCFAVIIFLYSNGPAQFVTVGGATSSLVGLTPSLSMVTAQVGFFAGVVMLVICACVRSLKADMRSNSFLAASSMLVLLAASGVIGAGPKMLTPVRDRVTCVGVDPQICVGPGYARNLGHLRARLTHYLVALRQADVSPVPTRFDQSARGGEMTVAPLPLQVLSGDNPQTSEVIAAAYVRDTCDIFHDQRANESYSALEWWLLSVVDGQHIDDPTIPRSFTEGDRPTQSAFLRQAVNYLTKCGAPAAP